jgi:hypothetical protein
MEIMHYVLYMSIGLRLTCTGMCRYSFFDGGIKSTLLPERIRERDVVMDVHPFPRKKCTMLSDSASIKTQNGIRCYYIS